MRPTAVDCDFPGCKRTARVMINGDPTVSPQGWSSLTFRAMAGEVQMDFCADHTAAVVTPWVTVLERREVEAWDLGAPARLAAVPLVREPPDEDELEEDVAEEESGGLDRIDVFGEDPEEVEGVEGVEAAVG